MLAAVGVGAAALAALSVPAVWWGPVNVDEEVTLTIAPRSYASIWHIVWGERGGGPLHFLLEHPLLAAGGGLGALRLPSVLFAVLALPAAALVARELGADRVTAAVAVLLLAVAPLLVGYASFGRPHVLLAALLVWSAWLALRAGRLGGRVRWTGAGLALAGSLFVHPIAPLYALTLLGCALVHARAPLRALVRDAWPGVVAFLVVLVPYYVHTLHVLRRRYGVGGGARGRTYSGHSVVHDALTGFGAVGGPVNVFTVLAVAGLVALALRRRWRDAGVPLLVVAAPIVFFTFVPAHGRSAVFFTRYMLPAAPFFFLLVAAGVVAVLRRPPLVAAAVLLLAALQVWQDVDGLRKLHGLQLGRVAAAVRGDDANALLFGATGTIGQFGDISTLSYGRPPVLLDRYVALRTGVGRVDDDSCVVSKRFLRTERGVRRGLFLFYAVRADELDAGRRALGRSRLVARDTLLVAAEGNARALLRRALALRRAWARAVPRDFKVQYLIRADEIALRGGRCTPLGEYGDPDITPTRSIPPTQSP